jgi:hypothetical protein
MLMDVARRASLSAVLLGTLAGCTGLISEKPVFGAADYDTTGALLGHYRDAEGRKSVVVTRGLDGQLAFFGFESKTTKKKGSKDTEEVWRQAFYADAAAIALGGGDYTLQVSCTAIVQGNKSYAGWLGGKASPWRDYTAYGVIAQDRKQDHLWFSANFYESSDGAEHILTRYGAQKPKDSGGVRILPPNITRAAAMAMFRDLVAFDMTSDGSLELYRRLDRETLPDADETAALVVKDSSTCHRLQIEGSPPPEK